MDHAELRDEVLPLPSADSGYRRVLMLGTTGAGKTTVVRQLLGTHPTRERFPSTSTAKTTVADTEIIPGEGPLFRAAVTFMPRHEVEDHLLDNVLAAAEAIFDGAEDSVAFLKLLDHEGQRFRLSYLLGRPIVEDDDDVIDDDDDDIDGETGAERHLVAEAPLPGVDVAQSRRVVGEAVRLLRELVEASSANWQGAPTVGDGEDDVDSEQYLALQEEVAESATAAFVVDMLVGEVISRFSALDFGDLRPDAEGWPLLWTHASTDRAEFLTELSAFYGNSAASFGRLLTPVVNGIRVSGPFIPSWSDRPLRLVLIDSEGLGHNPASISSLSSSLVRKVAQSDAVLVVDNAQQPMQAGPLAALSQIVESGSVAKLHMLFTHLDAVSGANLTGYAARIAHVRESVENAFKSIETTAGSAAARALRRRAGTSLYYAGRLDRVLAEKDIFGRKGAAEFARLCLDLEGEDVVRDHGNAEIVVARRGVVLAVEKAAARFQGDWLVRVGAETPEPGSGIKPEHWSRVKALNRRIANGTSEEYRDLKPVADFNRAFQHVLYGMLQNPVRWQGQAISDEEQGEVTDTIALALSAKVIELAEQCIVGERGEAWSRAWALSGQGSTTRRTAILADDVIRRGAPIPTADLSPEAMELINRVEKIFDEVRADHQLVIE